MASAKPFQYPFPVGISTSCDTWKYMTEDYVYIFHVYDAWDDQIYPNKYKQLLVILIKFLIRL